MTALSILRHDLTIVRQTIIGRLLLVLSIGATLGSAVVGYLLSDGKMTGSSLGLSVWLIVGTVLPLGVLLIAAVTIAGDRESGRLRLLFGTPITKSDVFIGTLFSRVTVTISAVLLGFLIIGLISLVFSLGMRWQLLSALALFTLLVCVAYTSVGMAISAIASTRLRAVGIALVFYAWSGLWPQIVSQVAEPQGPRLGAPTTTETLSHFVGTLSPFGAYSQITTPARAIYAESVTGHLLATPTMVLILVFWVVVPFFVGYWWFPHVDL